MCYTIPGKLCPLSGAGSIIHYADFLKIWKLKLSVVLTSIPILKKGTESWLSSTMRNVYNRAYLVVELWATDLYGATHATLPAKGLEWTMEQPIATHWKIMGVFQHWPFAPLPFLILRPGVQVLVYHWKCCTFMVQECSQENEWPKLQSMIATSLFIIGCICLTPKDDHPVLAGIARQRLRHFRAAEDHPCTSYHLNFLT